LAALSQSTPRWADRERCFVDCYFIVQDRGFGGESYVGKEGLVLHFDRVLRFGSRGAAERYIDCRLSAVKDRCEVVRMLPSGKYVTPQPGEE